MLVGCNLGCVLVVHKVQGEGLVLEACGAPSFDVLVHGGGDD
jgi:hypothetical protein